MVTSMHQVERLANMIRANAAITHVKAVGGGAGPGAEGQVIAVARDGRYYARRIAETVFELGPTRVLVLGERGDVLGAMEVEEDDDDDVEVEANSAAAIYKQAYADIERVFQAAHRGAEEREQARAEAWLEQLKALMALRQGTERDRLAAARELGQVQAATAAQKAEARAHRRAAQDSAAEEGGADVASQVAQELPAQLRPLLMELLPQLARDFGLMPK